MDQKTRFAKIAEYQSFARDLFAQDRLIVRMKADLHGAEEMARGIRLCLKDLKEELWPDRKDTGGAENEA